MEDTEPQQDPPFEHHCWRPGCGHVSHSAFEAFNHWRDHEIAARPENQPIVGKGERISVVLNNGRMYTGIVTDYDIDKETGEHMVTVGEPFLPTSVFDAATLAEDVVAKLDPTHDT